MSETPSSENEDVNVGDSAMDSQDAQDDSENVPQVEEEQKEKLLRLPLSRVKYIAKYDPDVNLVNQEASFLLTKSTELFIESLSKEAYKYTAQAKKKTIQKQDIVNAIDNVDALVFLEEMIR